MANYPQLDNASGVWNLREVYDAVMGGYWPNANSRALIESSDGGGVIGFVTIASTGNASVFGKPLALTGGDQTGFSSFTRGVFQGNSPLDTYTSSWTEKDESSDDPNATVPFDQTAAATHIWSKKIG